MLGAIMTKTFMFILIVALSFKAFGQKTNKHRLFPIPCFDYKYQNLNSFGLYLGIGKFFKRHTYIGLVPGINLNRYNKLTYVSPSVFIDYYYQPKFWRGIVGPSLRLGFDPIKITGQKANYLWADIGLRIAPVCVIFCGYNYCLDKKAIVDISQFRIGIRFP